MRAASSLISVSIHAALGAAALFGSANAGRSTPPRPREVSIVLPEPVNARHESSIGLPEPQTPAFPDVPPIALPSTALLGETPSHPVFATYPPPASAAGSAQPSGGWRSVLTEAGPEVLAGPLPVYPELLRRAGVQGHVLLEALVDTTGRVQPASVAVISVSHVGFVAPARQALLATLFRPARVGGRAVPMLVRVPFDFAIRGDSGPAR